MIITSDGYFVFVLDENEKTIVCNIYSFIGGDWFDPLGIPANDLLVRI